mmetsp:Transcript_29909/g.66269  ORF Transcript_29909/g.66269 Transcript_29909/m.66269 type:complete len:124 (-) Transcript_29909:8-379(-)
MDVLPVRPKPTTASRIWVDLRRPRFLPAVLVSSKRVCRRNRRPSLIPDQVRSIVEADFVSAPPAAITSTGRLLVEGDHNDEAAPKTTRSDNMFMVNGFPPAAAQYSRLELEISLLARAPAGDS